MRRENAREQEKTWKTSSSCPPCAPRSAASTARSAALSAHVLGAEAIKAAMERAKLDPADVDEVILGQVLTAAQGQNPARQAARAAGIPDAPPPSASTRSAAPACARSRSAAQQIRTGESDIVVAGGQESMSQSTARRLPARRPEDGRPRPDRHHDQGRAVGRLQRLPHGHDRRERRHQVPDHPPAAGRVRRRQPAEGRARRRRPASSRTRSRP